MTLFAGPPMQHLSLARHLTAERRVESYTTGRGVVVTWERIRKANHWLDALYLAAAAGWLCGARVVGPETTAKSVERAVRPPHDLTGTTCLIDRERLDDMAARTSAMIQERWMIR